jgi:hypothetical protein
MLKYRKRMTGNFAEKIPMVNVDEGMLVRWFCEEFLVCQKFHKLFGMRIDQF